MTNVMAVTRVKICGITSVEDARHAVAAGADALGLVFYDKSPRAVNVLQAQNIAQVTGPFVTLVGLFVNASAEFVNRILQSVPLQVLQFHGDENAAFCEQFKRPWYKAIRMHPELDLASAMSEFTNGSGYLFDAWHKDKYGGTGDSFEWTRMPNTESAVILAGGLNPDNVSLAINMVKPYAVDVSGGVEKAPGIKDPRLVTDFISNAKNTLVIR